jgi:hypothetical protein
MPATKPITKTPWATTYQDQAVTLPDNSPSLAPNKTQAPLSIQDSGVLYHEPLASNWLNFQLDETYQWIDYFEEVTDDIVNPTVPAGWTSTVKEVLALDPNSLGELDVAPLSEITTLSVGPTGSGADVIWTAMNAIPTSATAIRVKARAEVDITSGTRAECRIYLAPIGVTANSGANLAVVTSGKSSAAIVDFETYANAEATVRLDANNIFNLYWFVNNDGLVNPTSDIDLRLISYLEA